MDKKGKETILQAMTGLRGYSPDILQNLKGYASFKAGYGMLIKLEDNGFAYEIEAGALLANSLVIGFVYNVQNLQGSFSDKKGRFICASTGFRIGYNF
jgi:hypothetical protein